MLVVLSWFSNHGNSLLPKLDADILQANAQIIKMTEEIENTYLAARLERVGKFGFLATHEHFLSW